MGQARESSLLFSLQSLISEQEQREEAQRVEAQRKQETEQRRAEEALRVHQKTEELRLRQEREQQRLAEQQKREQEARLQALHQAELERARVAMDTKARLELAERQAEHARRLQALRREATRSIDRWIGIVGMSAGILSTAAAALLYFYQLVPERQRLEARYGQLLQAERQRAGHAERVAASERRHKESLRAEFKQTIAELKEARQKLAEIAAQRSTPPSGRVRAPSSKGSTPCEGSGHKYDPLDPCLR